MKTRYKYVIDYCELNVSFVHLEEEAPFVAYELKRQGLSDIVQLRQRMGYS